MELSNGAYEDDTRRRVPIIFLAGPIKHWWTCWGSPRHRGYVTHREGIRQILIDAGYLTYASWDAFKGAWDPRAQAINDMAISVSDLLIVMTPTGIPADGTEEETDYARRVGVQILAISPGYDRPLVLETVERMVGKGSPYE